MMHSVEWKHTQGLVEYPHALAWMEQRVQGIIDGTERECVWLVEHPPLYTAGTSTDVNDLLDARFPVYTAGRGGEYTYHGPGQRVAYTMLNLNERPDGKKRDVRAFVKDLEQWIINTLKALDIKGETREGRIGVWVQLPTGSEAKIAALGIRIRKWVTFHGIAINLNPDLSHYLGIVPCGIREFGVTSVEKLGRNVTMEQLDAALQEAFTEIFER